MKYGWRPDTPDQRDHLLAITPIVLPTSMDLRPFCPPVYDQGDLGSCTANAIAGALEFDQIKQNLLVYTPSRLFIYYNERVLENSVNSDAGAEIRDGIKTVSKQGDCPETLWPYDVTKFAMMPPLACYTDAKRHTALSYKRVTRSLTQMKGCLASNLPFVFGISVYSSFEDDDVATTGMIPMPKSNEELLGGHAILCVGYDDSKQSFIFRNSWGTSWGLQGYAYIPYSYLLDTSLSSDFWTISLVK